MTLDFKKEMSVLGFFIVTLFLVSQNVFAFQVTGNSIQTGNATITAGITPDSWMYFLDVALERINLALTFNPTQKAKKGLNLARERLMEVSKMIKENKLNDARISQQGYINALNIVQSSVNEIKKTNSTQQIRDQIEIEKDLAEHKAEIEQVKGELNIRMKVKGNISEKQQVLVNSIFGSLENKTGEVETEIESEKNKTRTEMEQQTGKNEKEVENEIKDFEKSSGLTKIRKDEAWNKINDAGEEINKTIEISNRLNLSNRGNVTNLNVLPALNLLDQAKNAYFEKDYKGALRLAVQSENHMRNYNKQFEKKIETEKEIEVKTGNNQSRVKVGIFGVNARFVLNTSNKDKIISEIASRTGLSISEIKGILKIKKEEPKQEIEVEIEIEDGVAKVKTKVNEVENEFILNTTNREKIISEIKNRTGLTTNQIEKNADFSFKGISEKEINRKGSASGKRGSLANRTGEINRREGINESEARTSAIKQINKIIEVTDEIQNLINRTNTSE